MSAILFALFFTVAIVPCDEPRRATTVHDLYCAARYPPTEVKGRLYPACQSTRHAPESRTWYDDGNWRPHDPTRLGMVWWADNRPNMTDKAHGYLCDACARIEEEQRRPVLLLEAERHLQHVEDYP